MAKTIQKLWLVIEGYEGGIEATTYASREDARRGKRQWHSKESVLTSIPLNLALSAGQRQRLGL